MITWIKTENNTNQPLNSFQPGDLINYWLPGDTTNIHIGEIVDVEDGRLVTHYLQKQASKLWHFGADDPEHHVDPNCVVRHVQHKRGKQLTREVVKNAWDMMGYVVGVEDYCLKADEVLVTLDMGDGDSESEEEECDSEMDDFIVPDEEGEAFCTPNPEHLTEEERKWVNTTHSAVRDWDGWVPIDASQQRVKHFVDNMAAKYHHREDDRRFEAGLTSLQKPI